MKISVIIPVYNEEELIAACLSQFEGKLSELEVIVVDGGSTDDTLERARALPAIKLFKSDKLGRAYQMNKGAKVATGEWLLFLHADTLLPLDWRNEVYKAKAGGFKAGCFVVDHGKDEKLTFLEKIGAWITNRRSRYHRYPYGDQAIFVAKEAFEKIKGYKPIPIMEDYDLSKRLYKSYGKLYHSQREVVPSFRRFKGRLLRTAFVMITIPRLYTLGISPRLLAKFYKKIR